MERCAAPPPDDPLAALFAGKRRWPRVAVGLGVLLEGPARAYAGRLLDLSAGGLLAVVEDPAFYGDGGDALARVVTEFPDGLRVRFLGRGLARRAEVVRITPVAGDRLALGCRLLEPLAPSEAAQLGLGAGGEAGEQPPAAARWVPRGRRPISLLLFAPGPVLVAGPRCVGRLVAAGVRSVEAAVPAPAGGPSEVAGALEDRALALAVAEGRRRLHEGEARLLACETDGGDALRVRLAAITPLSAALRRRLRPAAA